MRQKLPLFAPTLLIGLIELAAGWFDMNIVDWFYLHIILLLSTVVIGLVLLFFRKHRKLACLFLSSGLTAALAGVAAYTLDPLFRSPSPATMLAEALGYAFGPFIFAAIAIAVGLAIGWLPVWLCLRSRNAI